MEKLSGFFKKLWEKFLSFSKKIRIVMVVALVSVLIAIVSLVIFSFSSKYAVLYSNLDPSDVDVVIAKLNEDKVDMKVQGNSILVNKNQVDSLRLELASQLSSGSKGYELMDDSSSFGMTDEEFSIKKLRMIQGELEKSIKSLEPVESARVHITPAQDSVFVQNKEPGKAAVILKVKSGTKISEEQVKSIVALISMSTENIPKENVEVIDDQMNLLTDKLSSDSEDSGVSTETIQGNKDLETKYEEKLKSEVVSFLEPVLGKNKIRVEINVDMDFDSKKQTQTVIDPNKVIVSQQTIKEWNNANGGTSSDSPVDNNMSNTIEDGDGSSSSGSESQTTNYDTGKTETTVITAPGEVKRLTASVFIDGRVDNATKEDLSKAIGNAIGFDAARGDEISLVGMEFDPALKEDTQAQIDAFNKELTREKIKTYVMYGVGALVIILILVLIFVLVRKRNSKDDERALDVVIDDGIGVKEAVAFTPLDFEDNSEKTIIEKEIKKYAKDKPEQVVDIIKSWLTENER